MSRAQGSVTQIDLAKKVARIANPKTKEESEESYDYLIAASGLRRVWPVVPQSFSRAEYLVESGNHIEAVKNAKEGVVVIGGGQYCLTSNYR